MVGLPERRKTMLVARTLIQDESLAVGDIRDVYRFDMLSPAMEHFPVFEVGTVFRIHHMVVERWQTVPDGRVYRATSVTAVRGRLRRLLYSFGKKKKKNLRE